MAAPRSLIVLIENAAHAESSTGLHSAEGSGRSRLGCGQATKRVVLTSSTAIKASPDAEEVWVAHVNEVGSATPYPRANSWYMDPNIPGTPQIFMPYIGGVGAHRQACDAASADGYRGFRISPSQ
jgi:hypothetical protein